MVLPAAAFEASICKNHKRKKQAEASPAHIGLRLARPMAQQSASSLHAHLGPIPVKGTITSAQRELIKDATSCSAAVRERNQWGARMLTVTGPASGLQEAHAMALKFIEENGEDKGRADPPSDCAKKETKKKWQGSWNSWNSWSNWDADKWVPRSEHEELQNRLQTAEGTIAGLQWRMSCWESWHYYQGQPSYGYVYQSSSAEARPARERRAEARPAKDERDDGDRGPSCSSITTKSPSEESNRTVLPEKEPAEGSHAKKRKKRGKDRQRCSEGTADGHQPWARKR